MDEAGLPVRVVVTSGTTADCTKAAALIEGLSAGCLIADRGYDTDAIVEQARSAGMEVVIPARRHRRQARDYDKMLYRKRHRVENAFLRLKQWRSIATRYAKNAASYLAAVQIRCLFIYLNIL